MRARGADRVDRPLRPGQGRHARAVRWTRIHGAVLDELRRQDWAPRSLRRWERDIEQARETFTGVHGRPPSRDELAGTMDMTSRPSCARKEHEIANSDRHLARTRSSCPTTRPRSSGSTRSSPRTCTPIPSTQASKDEAKDKFRRAFERLPQREREVAVLLYVKNLTLREIGEILGVSESRVSPDPQPAQAPHPRASGQRLDALQRGRLTSDPPTQAGPPSPRAGLHLPSSDR